MKHPRLFLCVILAASSAMPAATASADPAPAVHGQAQPVARVQSLIDKGLEFLKSQQKPDGSWQNETDQPALTAIVLKAFLGDAQYDAKNPLIERGFRGLLAYQKSDGGIYRDALLNYNTAIAVSALSAAKNPEYRAQLDRAVGLLTRLQWSDKDENLRERRSVDEKNPNFGGWGYGKKERADGSNMQLALDALHDAGLKSTDPAFKNAIKFASRMQNLSETNDQSWSGEDGGFVYTPANNGESFAGEYKAADGQRRLRSYGSMTYAGLKSLIYAGLTKDDPRVKAALAWVSRNWTLDENPGMKAGDPSNATNGLYYYYHTLARCLNASEEAFVIDSKEQRHDWRQELIDKLASLQRPDGSWAGEKRWMEDNPALVTAYAVIALEEAKASLGRYPAEK